MLLLIVYDSSGHLQGFISVWDGVMVTDEENGIDKTISSFEKGYLRFALWYLRFALV